MLQHKCTRCAQPTKAAGLCEACHPAFRVDQFPNLPAKEVGPNGRLRFRRGLQKFPERRKPAGPRRLRCAACCRALTRHTRVSLTEPGLVLGVALEAGAIICRVHPVHPGRACPACSTRLYTVPGAALSGELVYLDSDGREVQYCPWCWAPLSARGADTLARLAERVRRQREADEQIGGEP